MLADQMGQITEFFGAPPVQNKPMPLNLNPRPVQILVERLNNGAPVPKYNNLLLNHNHKRSLRGSQS